jgi:hypothetical protein
MVPRAEAREARNAADAREAVEAAQAAAAAALAAELEVVRRGRADAEAREAALQEEVHPKHNCKRTHSTVCAPTKQAAGVVVCWQLAVPAEQDTGESLVQGFTTTKQQHQLRLAFNATTYEHVDLHGRRFGCAASCFTSGCVRRFCQTSRVMLRCQRLSSVPSYVPYAGVQAVGAAGGHCGGARNLIAKFVNFHQVFVTIVVSLRICRCASCRGSRRPSPARRATSSPSRAPRRPPTPSCGSRCAAGLLRFEVLGSAVARATGGIASSGRVHVA